MPVVVVTDSSCGLTPETATSLGIRVAPLHVLIGGHDLREGVDVLPAAASTRGMRMTTAGASPTELAEIYRHALASSCGDGVVAVHISSKLSSTWEAARVAAATVGPRVRVVDSRSAGMGLGFAAIFAAEAAEADTTLDGVYRVAVDGAARSRCFIMVDDLDHLRRGGRIGTAASMVGTALSMKPVLHLVNGELVLREKARTTSKAVIKMVEAASMQRNHQSQQVEVALAVHHVQDIGRATQVADLLKTAFPLVGDVSIIPFGTVLGAHVGPGAIGVVVSFRPR